MSGFCLTLNCAAMIGGKQMRSPVYVALPRTNNRTHITRPREQVRANNTVRPSRLRINNDYWCVASAYNHNGRLSVGIPVAQLAVARTLQRRPTATAAP